MLFLKYAVLTSAVGFFMTAVLVVLFDAQRVWRLSRTMEPGEWPAPRPLLWRKAARVAAIGCLIGPPALGLAMIPACYHRSRAPGLGADLIPRCRAAARAIVSRDLRSPDRARVEGSRDRRHDNTSPDSLDQLLEQPARTRVHGGDRQWHRSPGRDGDATS
jgi:hypothetical protein